jgi:hypothetical protein
MAKRPVKRARQQPLEPPRSAKAGSPPRTSARSPQVRRRQKTASPSLSKGTTLFETDHGPRAAWPASTSKRKKR